MFTERDCCETPHNKSDRAVTRHSTIMKMLKSNLIGGKKIEKQCFMQRTKLHQYITLFNRGKTCGLDVCDYSSDGPSLTPTSPH